MALFGTLGNILGKSSAKLVKSNVSLSNPSIHQMIRCMSSKLFIGGLSYNTDEQGLWEAFGKYGEVTEAKVIMDRETGRSRGFGFVTFSNAEEASSAIQALDQQELHGRTVKVNYATERAPRVPVGGYGGSEYNNQGSYGGRGGYGAQGYDGYGYNQGSHGGGYGTQGYGGENQAFVPPTQSDGSAGNFSSSGGNNGSHDGGGYGTQGYGGENQVYAPPTHSDGSAGNFSFSGGNNSSLGRGGYGTQGYGGENQAYASPTQGDGSAGNFSFSGGNSSSLGGGGYGTQGYGGENQASVSPTQGDGSAGNFSFSGGNNSYADPSSNGYNGAFGQSDVNPLGGTEGMGGDIGLGNSAEGYSRDDNQEEGFADRRG